MTTFDFWANEWSAIGAAPHVAVFGAVAIILVAASMIWPLIHRGYARHTATLQEQLRLARKTRHLAGPANAVIEYHGEAGISRSCQNAIMRLLQYGTPIHRARLVSCLHPAPRKDEPDHVQGMHGFLLTTDDKYKELIAIKAGFASGYWGEGPRTLSYVLALLEGHGIEVKEYEVDKEFIDPAHDSSRVNEYLIAYEKHYDDMDDGTLWKRFPPIVPFGIVDSRLIDLARTFWEDPAARLYTGYIRLEDIVRERTGLKEHGHDLFAQAFQKHRPKLRWKVDYDNEREGRALLFIGAYKAHRNPRFHSELKAGDSLTEFLLLNHLYLLEGEAMKVETDPSTSESTDPTA